MHVRYAAAAAGNDVHDNAIHPLAAAAAAAPAMALALGLVEL